MRYLRVLIAVIILSLAFATPALAAYSYRASLTVAESNGTSYTMLPLIASVNNTFLAANGYMSATGLDTRVQTLGGVNKPHMVADNKTLFAVPVGASSQTNLYYTTGDTPLSDMDIVLGYGGYFTVADNAALELGNNFHLSFDDVYISSSVNSTPAYKTGAYWLRNTEGTVAYALPLSPTSAGGSGWANATSLYDRNEATAALYSGGFGWSEYITANITSTLTTSISFKGTTIGSNPDASVEVYYNSSWNVISDTAMTGSLTTVNLASSQNVTSVRIKGYGEGEGIMNVFVYEIYINGGRGIVVADGVYDIDLQADGTNIWMSVGSETTTNMTTVTIPDNANNHIFGQSIPYLGSVSITTGGTLRATYDPEAIISGATLPNVTTPGSYTGTITWGSNPAGVTVSLGGLVSAGQPEVGSTGTSPSRDQLPGIGGPDVSSSSTLPTSLLTNPLRPFVTIMSDTTTITELQAWRYFGLMFVLIVLITAVALVPRHLVIAGGCTAAAVIALVVMQIWPMYALILAVLLIFGGWVSERSPSL